MPYTQTYNKGFSPLCPKCGDIMIFQTKAIKGLASAYTYDNWICDSDEYYLCFSKAPTHDKDVVYWKEKIINGWNERPRGEIEWVDSEGNIPEDKKKSKKETPKVPCFICNKDVTNIKVHISKEHPWLK